MQPMTAPTAAHVDTILRQIQLDAAIVKQSHQAYRRYAELQAGRPAGWHGPTDIVTLVGLEGDFFWSEDWIRPARMSFRFDAGREGSQGTYALSTMVGDLEEGVFYCVPNNPAIGWACIGLVPDGGAPRGFTVAGMLTDSSWRISVLMLNKLGADGPVNPPFSVLRIL